MPYSKAQLEQLVIDYANSFGINATVALIQARRESANFRPDVVYGPFRAGAGERGVMQFTPGAWQDWGEGPHTDAYIPEKSLQAWGRYMTWLLNRYRGNYTKALQAYNGGAGNVDRGTVSTGAQKYAREILAKAASAGVQISTPGNSLPDSGGDLPESNFPDIVFDDGTSNQPDNSSDNSSDDDKNNHAAPLLIGAAALLLLFVLMPSD